MEPKPKFSTFSDLEKFIKEKEEKDALQLFISDSRKVESCKNRVKRFISSDLIYYQIKYKCIHSGSRKSTSKGQKPNKGKLNNHSLAFNT